MPSVIQWPRTKGPQKGSVACSWGLELSKGLSYVLCISSQLSIWQACLQTCVNIPYTVYVAHTLHIYVQIHTYAICTVIVTADFPTWQPFNTAGHWHNSHCACSLPTNPSLHLLLSEEDGSEGGCHTSDHPETVCVRADRRKGGRA